MGFVKFLAIGAFLALASADRGQTAERELAARAQTGNGVHVDLVPCTPDEQGGLGSNGQVNNNPCAGYPGYTNCCATHEHGICVFSCNDQADCKGGYKKQENGKNPVGGMCPSPQ